MTVGCGVVADVTDGGICCVIIAVCGCKIAVAASVGFTTAYKGSVANGVNNLGITTSSMVVEKGVLAVE